MSIVPLPQFEADLKEAQADSEAYAKLKPPTSIVVRFGSMRLIGEYPYKGDAKPGCGSKLVVKTHRGTELGEMLTSTCPNAGCSKSITRAEMLEYIERSGGKDYPFYEDGKVLRVATLEDMAAQRRIEERQHARRVRAQAEADALRLDAKVVEVEEILGGERATVFYTAPSRIDFRELVRELARWLGTRIEMRQIGARDEARLVADYERCGQHCCCKQFLKVLKPVSMRSAKVQRATLDPLKISGRCGRLLCCLRYEDETYEDLRRRLPKMRARVGTSEGVGVVVDKQVLTQLVRVRLEDGGGDVAVPVEELIAPEEAEALKREGRKGKASDPLRGVDAEEVARRSGRGARRRGKSKGERQDEYRDRAQREGDETSGADAAAPTERKKKKRRRTRKKSTGAADDRQTGEGESPKPSTEQGDADPARKKGKKKRRRKRSRGGDGAGGASDQRGDAGPQGGGPNEGGA
jgi:cell fate regulator YaaT (PSP1 superfamily)